MNLTDVQDGVEYIIKKIVTDDEEMDAFLFLWAATAANPLQW